MPWYNENFDFDLEATQVLVQQHKLYDLSEAAINRVRKIYANEENVNFIVDDILNSKLKDNEFDYIFDRGCFHVILPADRQKYISKIKQILKKNNGILFLKCFSDKEPREEGPYKFSPDEIRTLFGESFRIDSIKERFIKELWIRFQRHYLLL